MRRQLPADQAPEENVGDSLNFVLLLRYRQDVDHQAVPHAGGARDRDDTLDELKRLQLGREIKVEGYDVHDWKFHKRFMRGGSAGEEAILTRWTCMGSIPYPRTT
jgi:hypothetical protein